jgi:serine/threonine-protein kinase
MGAELLADIQLPERYRLVRRIASGGMASVWCAEDQVLGRRVAIKLLSERYAHDEMAVQRFKREARVAARLSGHQNIVTIFDVGEGQRRSDEASTRAFIVMEFLAGGTVADALRVGEVSREEAVAWVRQTASALDYAHARGVVHRDIKPANLLLDCDRVVHVADFGIARVATDETFTRTDVVLGTAAYIAPEQALGRPATAASDRYSLAVAAFELLVGERPFTGSQFAAQARQHVEEEPPSASLRNPELPPALDAVVARGMAKQPGDRWPSAGAFADALESALSPRTAHTRVVPPVTQRSARSPGRSLALAALAAAILGVVLVATALPGSRQRRRATAQIHHPVAAPARTTAAKPPPKPKPKPAPPVQQTTSTSTEVTATQAATTTPAAGADSLEADGHALMTSGNYQAAIPILQQAVSTAPKGSLTYAYALYDLGRSLRLAGDPRQAAQVLAKRLQIPNQTGTVRHELQAALLALGQKAQGGPPGHGRGHGHDNPHGGGD